MYAVPQSPQTIGGVLDSTITLFKASFRHCWPAAALYSVVNLVLTVWIQQRVTSVALSPGATPAELLASISAPAIWGGYLLVTLFSVFIYLVMSATIVDIARGRPGRNALTYCGSTLQLMPGAIGLVLALFFGFLVAGVVFAIVAAMVGMGAGVAGGGAGSSGAVAIIMVLLLLAACTYLVVRWTAWPAAYTDRREGAFVALGTSWKLVEGNWWRTFVAFSVVVIIILILVSLLGAVSGYAAAAGGQDSFAQIVVGSVLQAVLQILYLPALSACIVAIYMDLQLRKGGADLEARLGSLGSQA